MRTGNKVNLLCRTAAGAAALILLCTCAAFPAAADKTKTFSDGVVTYEKITGGLKIVSVDGSTTALHVGRDVDGMPVLSVGENAFSACSAMTELSFPSGVTEFENGALYGCTALTALTLPDTLTKIGDGAFAYCSALTELELPESVTEIGAYAFSNCSRLTHVTIPGGVKTLNPYTFQGDVLLESVTLPEGLETIDSASFMNCLVLRELEIPASVKTIGEVAIVACPALQAVRVAEGNENYQSLDDCILTDRNAETLMLYPGNREITEYTVPDSVKEIAPYAFAYAMSLESLTIPDTVEKIGAAAFSKCWKLRAVRYPAGIKSIGSSVFADCTALESFTIPEGVTEIESCAFLRCSSLNGITLPASVETVGEYAFAGCSGIRRVDIPETVKAIGNYAFGYDAEIADDGTITATKMKSFTIHGKPKTAAKTYAKSNKLDFDSDGFDPDVLVPLGIAAAAVLMLIAAALLVYRRRRALDGETSSSENPEPEGDEYEDDPNYVSILADDDGEEGDPYDRSYGFQLTDSGNETSLSNEEKDEPGEFPDD